MATSGGPLTRMGRRLMLANLTSYFDHYPVHVDFTYLLAHPRLEGPQLVPEGKYDMDELLEVKHRLPFMAKLESVVHAFNEAWKKVVNSTKSHSLANCSLSCMRPSTKLPQPFSDKEKASPVSQTRSTKSGALGDLNWLNNAEILRN